MDIVTQAAQSYMKVFHGYVQQFLHWGQWLFFGLLTLNIVWLCLWYAFEKHSFADSMPDFIKRFFVITLFYSIMVNPAWLVAVLSTVQGMGSALTHAPVDPSSLIAQGIALGNKIILPIEQSSLLTSFFGVVVVLIVYVIILFVFVSIALDLALTLITVTALIAMASFFLGFAALGATSAIARQTLDVILGHCVKLLGLYVVVAAGSETIRSIAAAIPTQLVAFDPYAWIVAASVLFWLLAKHLPQQLARIVTGAVQEMQGTGAVALALSAGRSTAIVSPVVRAAAGSAIGLAQVAGGTVLNAGSHLHHNLRDAQSASLGLGKATLHTVRDLGQAVGGHLSDHARHLASKAVGGPGFQQAIPSVAERLYRATRDIPAGRSDSDLARSFAASASAPTEINKTAQAENPA